MRLSQLLRIAGGMAVVGGLGVGAFLTQDRWRPWLASAQEPAHAAETASAPVREAKVLKLSPQARKNLGLVTKAAKLQTYWRTIQVPGAIVDRPGRSDEILRVYHAKRNPETLRLV